MGKKGYLQRGKKYRKKSQLFYRIEKSSQRDHFQNYLQ